MKCIHLHLGRCGGSKLKKAYVARNGYYIPLNSKVHTKAEIKKSITDKDHFDVIGGHPAFYKILENRQYFTFLRHPVDREISIFNDATKKMKNKTWGILQKTAEKHLKDFEYWYSNCSLRNMMTLHFSQSYQGEIAPSGHFSILANGKLPKVTKKDFNFAKKMLDQCFFIGITERTEDFVSIFSILNLPYNEKKINSSPNICKKDSNLRKLIEKENAFDIELYFYAINKRNSF